MDDEVCPACGAVHDLCFPCYCNDRIFPARSGTQFVAGPFLTEAEAREAIRLLMMPAEGTA